MVKPSDPRCSHGSWIGTYCPDCADNRAVFGAQRYIAPLIPPIEKTKTHEHRWVETGYSFAFCIICGDHNITELQKSLLFRALNSERNVIQRLLDKTNKDIVFQDQLDAINEIMKTFRLEE